MARARIPVLAVLALLAASLAGRGEAAGDPPVIRIVAKKFSYTPTEVRVPRGTSVVLELVSEDRVHGFNLPALGIRKDVPPNTVTRVTITPQKTGTFPFHCDVFCGEGHDEMTGRIVVTE